MSGHDHLRYTLSLARTCVHQGQAHQALEYLNSIQLEIEDLAGTALSAEYELVYAGALAAMNEPTAEGVFEDALRHVEALAEPESALAMSAHEDYAKYLAGRHATKRARQHYQRAEKFADSLGREQCAAHYQMCVIGLDLQETKSPHLRAFQRLQEAAKDGYTEVQQREAWIHYTEQFGEFEPQLVATRKGAEASADYFRGVLSKIKRGRK